MSWSLSASVLIVAEARAGQWCSVAWLAEKVFASPEAVRPACDELAAHGLLQTRLHYGAPLYGMDVVTDYPVINDTAEHTQWGDLASQRETEA